MVACSHGKDQSTLFMAAKVRQMWRCGDAEERRDVEAHTRTALRPETTAATMSGNKGSIF